MPLKPDCHGYRSNGLTATGKSALISPCAQKSTRLKYTLFSCDGFSTRRVRILRPNTSQTVRMEIKALFPREGRNGSAGGLGFPLPCSGHGQQQWRAAGARAGPGQRGQRGARAAPPLQHPQPLRSARPRACSPEPPSRPPLPFTFFGRGNSLLPGPYLFYLLRLVYCKDSCQTTGSLGLSF